MKSKDLAAAGIQGQPQPLRVGLFADKAPEFVRFNLQGIAAERIGTLPRLRVKMGGRPLVALDSEKPSAISCPRLRHGRCRVAKAVPSVAARSAPGAQPRSGVAQTLAGC